MCWKCAKSTHIHTKIIFYVENQQHYTLFVCINIEIITLKTIWATYNITYSCSNIVWYGVNCVFAPLIESLSSVLCVNLALSLWIKSSVRFSVGPLAVWMWQVHKFCDGEKKRDVCHERCKLRDGERGQTDLWTLCVCVREREWWAFCAFSSRLNTIQTSYVQSD